MNPHPVTLSLWGLLSIAEAITVAVILFKGAARRWPSLLTIAVFDLVYYALAYTHLGLPHYAQYFYIFWYGQALRALLSLGLIWDIARSVPCLNYVPKQIGLVLIALGITVTVGAVLITSHHHSNIYPLIATILMIRECVAVTWMCLSLSLVMSVSRLGMGWPLEALKVTGGFLISGMAAVLAANCMNSRPIYRTAIDNIQNCIEIAVFISWSVVLCRPSLPDEVLSDSALNVVSELFEEQPLV